MALSSKAITVFATLEALRDNQADIRYPLTTMFEPDLATFNGEVLILLNWLQRSTPSIIWASILMSLRTLRRSSKR